MKFNEYFDEIAIEQAVEGSLGTGLFPIRDSAELDDCKLAILFVNEKRFSDDDVSPDNHHEILNQLATLFVHGYQPKIAVLGKLKLGNTIGDTEAAVSQIVLELVKLRVLPIVVGGTRDITYSIYKAFEELEQVVNITSIDSKLNIESSNAAGYIGRIIKEQPNYLFNYSNLGYQTYLVSEDELSLSDELYFDTYRLGELRGSIIVSEPIIRSSEILTVSMDVIKSSDFDGSMASQPNGLYAEELCQTMRYAGLGEKLRAICLNQFVNEVSDRDTSLVAQMLWCLIDGMYSRRSEIPNSNNADFLKYRVALKDDEFDLVFYKSLKTDRWWMEVPVPPEYSNRYRKHHLIPCAYEDYKQATNDELPDRWWRAYKKLL